MNREKAIKYLSLLQQSPKFFGDQEEFKIAICHVQLGNYAEAQRLFEKSFLGMFTSPKLWEGTNQPNWLVDICVLSNRLDMLPKVQKELELFKGKFEKQYGLVAHYAFSLVGLYLPSGWDVAASVEELLKRPKIKDMYAIGKALQAILDNDPSNFQEALLALLKAHEGMAKYGALRETAEGLLCMPAMSLGRMSLERNILFRVENEYYSNGYLQFLMGQQNSSGKML